MESMRNGVELHGIKGKIGMDTRNKRERIKHPENQRVER